MKIIGNILYFESSCAKNFEMEAKLWHLFLHRIGRKHGPSPTFSSRLSPLAHDFCHHWFILNSQFLYIFRLLKTCYSHVCDIQCLWPLTIDHMSATSLLVLRNSTLHSLIIVIPCSTVSPETLLSDFRWSLVLDPYNWQVAKLSKRGTSSCLAPAQSCHSSAILLCKTYNSVMPTESYLTQDLLFCLFFGCLAFLRPSPVFSPYFSPTTTSKMSKTCNLSKSQITKSADIPLHHIPHSDTTQLWCLIRTARLTKNVCLTRLLRVSSSSTYCFF